MYENELYHYGVKGMKWGVRRGRRNSAKRELKAESRHVRKHGLKFDYESDKDGNMRVTQYYNRKGEKISERRAEQIMKQVRKDSTVSALVGTAAVVTGSAVVAALLDN